MYLAIFLYLLLSLTMADYVPGEPGGAWTEGELLAVKAEVQWILRNPGNALNRVPDTFVRFHKNDFKSNYTGEEIRDRFRKKVIDGGINDGFFVGEAVLPDIAKVIRLAFHDCIKDEETGGCNGCLSFEGMGTENAGVFRQKCNQKKSETCARDFLPKTTDNNNLLWVSQVLEMVYNARLPIPPFTRRSSKNGETKYTEGSLKETGKSRADLWAYAGLVAIELGAQYHNNLCTPCTSSRCKSETTTFCAGQVDENSPSCAYKLPNITFKYGRKDCNQTCEGRDSAFGFCSPAHENHPNPHGNGQSVTKFFADDFGLTGRESIALLGAHTFGHANEQISGFRHYPWVDRHDGGQDRLNNDYYKNVVEREMYRMKPADKKPKNIQYHQMQQACDMSYSSFVGDEHGNPFHVDWVVRSQWQNEDGGPWNWNPMLRKCDERICDRIGKDNWRPTSCCRHFEKCKKDPDPCKKGWCGMMELTNKPEYFDCTMPFFAVRSYMNIDMGLYVKFDVNPGNEEGYGQGRPTGCSGLDRDDWLRNLKKRPGKVDNTPMSSYDPSNYLDFTSKNANDNEVASPRYSDVVVGKRFSGCPLNDDVVENGEKMHEIFETFANDSQIWVNEFVAVFQKMLENGYQPGNEKGNAELKESEIPWQEITCDRRKEFCSIGKN